MPGIKLMCPTVLLHPRAVQPMASNDEAMGYDIRCVAGVEGLQDPSKHTDQQRDLWERFAREGQVVLRQFDSYLFRTGFAQAIPKGYGCILRERSGLGAMKCLALRAGVIDSDYRGEWFVRLINLGTDDVVIIAGDKIVQGVYQERLDVACPIVQNLDATDRGSKGFGSTDQPTYRNPGT